MQNLTDTFRKLHQSGCFVIANPWDAGTARYLQHLGFPALATTSGGFAFRQALPDGAVDRDMMLAHIREIVEASDVPVNADFESGYAKDAAGVAENVRLCVETGVAGLSIEDAFEHSLFSLEESIERVRAARAAIDASGSNVLLTARAECYLMKHPDPLSESLRRLEAYAEAGADVLFAPGVALAQEIKTLVSAVAPKPFNLIVTRNLGLTVSEIAGLGVRRISVGSSLARAAWTAVMRSAEGIARRGDFSSFDDLVPYPEINGFFREDVRKR